MFDLLTHLSVAQTALPDILPDILSAIVNKNPQVKENSLKFLNRCLSTSATAIPPPQVKSLTDPISHLLEDGFAGARDEAAAVLGTLMKMIGERPLNALMDSLADVRKVKVKEAYESATVKCKSAAPKAAPPAAKAPPGKKTTAKKEAASVEIDEEAPKKPTAKPPARLAVRPNTHVIFTLFQPHSLSGQKIWWSCRRRQRATRRPCSQEAAARCCSIQGS